MTVVAGNDAYKSEENNLPVPLTHDLTQDLNISKESAQLLGSHFKEKHLLAQVTIFYWYQDHKKELRQFFTFQNKSSLVYCNNISRVIKSMT